MGTDRELLEAAAKAAGIEVWWNGRTCFVLKTKVATHEWNPLTSDADALRLAVKLELHVICNPILTDVAFIREIDGEKTIESFIQMTSKTDPYESTRRAIVRAAAEIGRSMK
jgi:hypothetical protein